jgi:hypothetical protein
VAGACVTLALAELGGKSRDSQYLRPRERQP